MMAKYFAESRQGRKEKSNDLFNDWRIIDPALGVPPAGTHPLTGYCYLTSNVPMVVST